MLVSIVTADGLCMHNTDSKPTASHLFHKKNQYFLGEYTWVLYNLKKKMTRLFKS